MSQFTNTKLKNRTSAITIIRPIETRVDVYGAFITADCYLVSFGGSGNSSLRSYDFLASVLLINQRTISIANKKKNSIVR
jgi:hypothetical protein